MTQRPAPIQHSPDFLFFFTIGAICVYCFMIPAFFAAILTVIAWLILDALLWSAFIFGLCLGLCPALAFGIALNTSKELRGKMGP